ncbi:RNA polymerase sigma factor, sigma-70 family [Ruminococcaceae bacterium YRB3002]|nr:RNA polymerase sigma factor, sigma-70 family [Ruminococcaceae bacterium YRB3002]
MAKPYKTQYCCSLEDIGEIGVEQEYKDVIEELNELTVKDRQIIHLYYYEDIALEKIAEILGISEPAARKRLSRARKQLEIKMRENGYGTTDV